MSALEADLDNFERRVKPKVEDAGPFHADISQPETPGTQNKHSTSSLKESAQQHDDMPDRLGPCHLSMLCELKSDKPLAEEPGSDASSSNVSVSYTNQSIASKPSIDIPKDLHCGDNIQGRGDQNFVPPSSSHAVQHNGNTLCSGGSGQCTTPHLPVKVRGMCNSCYQKEWRKKNSAYIPPAAPQTKKDEKLRPIIDPKILCDDYGVPMLDSFGMPIQVILIMSHGAF